MKRFLGLIIILFISGCVQFDDLAEYSDKIGDGWTDCLGSAKKFDYPPADLDKVIYIVPMGRVFREHVTPTDHQYYIESWNNPANTIDVYSPEDGTVTNIQHMGSFRGDGDIPVMDDYHVVIEHDCGLESVFIHIDELSPKLSAVAPRSGEYVEVNVPVKAGEILGTYSGSLDYNVIDKAVTIGLINPSSYTDFDQRIHISDPFDYFNDELRTQLIEKSLRTEKPEGGTIDYDVDGRLTGVWFRENTNGWWGLDPNRYWGDHLAIVYNHIDPEHVVISFGTYVEKTAQFGVNGNSPDPSDVSVETGLVRYELVDYDYYDNDQPWDHNSLVKGLKVKNGHEVNGVVLLQLIEDRKLKMEIFPDKTGNEVTGFTENAEFFER